MGIGITNLSAGISPPPPPPIPWEQPVLSSNGEWGVDELAVKVSGIFGSEYDGWKCFDNDSTTFWASNVTSNEKTLEFATIDKIVLKSLSIQNRAASAGPNPIKNATLYGSNDSIVYNKMADILNVDNIPGSTWTIITDNIAAYRYYRLNVIDNYLIGTANNYCCISNVTITATTADSNYIPYTIRVLTELGVEPASTYEERLAQMESLGVI